MDGDGGRYFPVSMSHRREWIRQNLRSPLLSRWSGKPSRRIRALPTIRFVPDDLSIGDASVFSLTDDVGSKGITDLYLLGLAAHHGIAFATLDESVGTDTVKDGGATLFVVPR